jgi:glycosyltransferase involved in cell wall biosynthesis
MPHPLPTLAIVETHPVQYHAPVWREAAQTLGLPVHVIYGGDFSMRGYRDREFGASFQWEADLLAGYSSQILQPAAADYDSVTAHGVEAALTALQPAAVLALGYHHPLDRAAIRWATRQRVPLLFRGETSDAPRAARTWWRRLLRDAMLRRLYRRCTTCLYLGAQAKAHYTRLGVPAQRLIHSPYCVDTVHFQTDDAARERLRPATRASLGIADTDWVLLFSGKLSWRKGVDLLPTALRQLPSPLRGRLHLIFLGAGERQAALLSACQQHPTLRCHVTGFVNQSGLSAWYHAADCLVLPSLEMETWGLVVNDALHHGLPAVVSEAVGCAPDLILPGQTGEVFTTGQAQALAAALARCAEWSAKAPLQVRQTCRNHVNHYSIAAAAAGLQQAWASVTTPATLSPCPVS